MIIVINLVRACVKTSAEDDDFQSLSKGEGGRGREREREREFYNFELLGSYGCTIQFLVVLYYEIEQQLSFPAGINKVLCSVTRYKQVPLSYQNRPCSAWMGCAGS